MLILSSRQLDATASVWGTMGSALARSAAIRWIQTVTKRTVDRNMWPYRDWVIRAINSGMPFDQFTIEQLAGDMLPDGNGVAASGTGFHRNTMLNEEGGIDPLEFRFYAMTDRVATTGTTLAGTHHRMCNATRTNTTQSHTASIANSWLS